MGARKIHATAAAHRRGPSAYLARLRSGFVGRTGLSSAVLEVPVFPSSTMNCALPSEVDCFTDNGWSAADIARTAPPLRWMALSR